MEKGKGRHELKYYINLQDYFAIKSKIRHLMKTDPNGNEKGEYEIISLYFDDIFNSAYFEKIQGVNKRKKFRIRIYNFEEKTIKLEKKSKVGEITSKEVTFISRNEYEKILNNDVDFILERNPDGFIDFYRGVKKNFLRPKVLVRYTREAYLMRAGNVRITFDKNLKTGNNNLDLFDENGHFATYDPNQIILEIKYDSFFPSHLKNLIQNTGKLRGSSSKYIMSRKFNYIY